MHHQIVILDRDTVNTAIIEFLLRDAGCIVQSVGVVAEATTLIQANPPDLLLLDPDLGQDDGLQVLATWRQMGFRGMCMVLTTRTALDEQLRAFSIGIDDYIFKPFEPRLLLARVRSALARVSQHAADAQPAIVSVGDASLSLIRQTFVVADAEPVMLTPIELRVLDHLMRNAGAAVSRAELARHVWGDAWDGDGTRVDGYIRRLRTKIEPDPARPRSLRTVRACGYMFHRSHQHRKSVVTSGARHDVPSVT